jgi:hypothetical protein
MRHVIAGAVATLFLVGGACSSTGGSGPAGGSGGRGAGTGGSQPGGGGASPGSGGSSSGSAGATAGTGGSAVGTAGSGTGTGGSATTGTGGGTGTAGRPLATGGGAAGGSVGTGGRPVGTGGGPVVACQMPIPVTTGTAATVTVNLDTTLNTVGPDLMGVHTAVYDGRLGTPGVLDLLRGAGVTSLRYPGGSYADLYHWETHTAVTTAPAMGAGSSVITITPGTDFGSFVSILRSINANAFITLNYGSNTTGTGPGVPEEAAAWVAYANALPSNTTVIGVDSTGRNWGTAGDWARLRASAPLTPDPDRMNILRISHPDPVGVKYWELGNEIYGNGFYAPGQPCGWEVDLHVPYPAAGAACTGRQGNAALAPTVYAAAVKAFSTAIKAVDPTVQFGAIVVWPLNNASYPNWNNAVFQQACAPGAQPSIDFVVNHWYPGTSIASLLTLPGGDIPAMYRDLRGALTTACGTRGQTMGIAISEWGPDTLYAGAAIGAAFAIPSQTQAGGIFAAESYANFMEQGALSVHFQQLHPGASGATYLNATDGPSWGYHGQLIAHALAGGGDTMVRATSTVTTLLSHAALRADGGVNVMLTNSSPTAAANVTVNLTGGSSTFACVGSRYAYTPVNTNLDGTVSTAQSIFSTSTGTSVPVGVPAYSVVVVSFPKR